MGLPDTASAVPVRRRGAARRHRTGPRRTPCGIGVPACSGAIAYRIEQRGFHGGWRRFLDPGDQSKAWATLDIFEADGASLFSLHMRACAGDLPDEAPRLGGAKASAIFYAELDVIAPERF